MYQSIDAHQGIDTGLNPQPKLAQLYVTVGELVLLFALSGLSHICFKVSPTSEGVTCMSKLVMSVAGAPAHGINNCVPSYV